MTDRIINIEKLNDSLDLDCDLCIIGSGPAGISLASKFTESDQTIIILESGEVSLSPRHTSLNDGISIGQREVNTSESRARRYGGGMHLWAGTSAPFSEYEFIGRSHINIEGWPIDWDNFSKYYREAALLLGINFDNFNKPYKDFKTQMSEVFANLNLTNLRSNNYFAAKNIDLTISLENEFRQSKNIKTYTNATVVDFECSDNDISSATVKTINGREYSVSSKNFILCTGALEAARLLMDSSLSKMVNPEHLGKNFMSHPSFTDLATITFEQKIKSWVSKPSLDTKVDFELSFEEQQSKKILRHNIHAAPSYEKSQSLVLSSSSISSEKTSNRKSHYNFLLTGWDLVCRIFGKRAWSYTWNISVGIEQEPMKDRNLSLSKDRNVLGQQNLIVNGGKISDLEKHTIDEALYGLKESLEANIDAKFKFSKKYLTGEYLEDQDSINHHIGTLKMASSSNEGMVDKDLKLFGLNNLYVSGSAVFPTSSNVNPTLTIVALSLRLGDFLKNKSN